MRGAAAATRPRNECVVRVRILSWSGVRVRTFQLRLWAAMGVLRRRNNGGAVLGSLFLAKILPCASYKRPWAARSGSRLRLAGPTTHQGSIWAPVIIRFPRRRRPMSCSWQTFTLSFGIHHMMVAGLQQCLRYGQRGLNTAFSTSPPRLNVSFLVEAARNLRQVAASRIAEQI